MSNFKLLSLILWEDTDLDQIMFRYEHENELFERMKRVHHVEIRVLFLQILPMKTN